MVLLVWSFLPCRWPFDPILSCQGSLLGCLDVIRPNNYEIPKKIDEERLLLVMPNFSKSRNKVLWYCRCFFHSYRYTTDILTTETTTGYRSVILCWVWEFYIVFIRPYWSILAPVSERSDIRKPVFIVLLKYFTVNESIPIAIE